ncbi:SH3 domain-containing protein C23A1.17-like [Penaeus japonicus]|uniref:SH3 domain-containing protein C23A1.17-like n=1 Tax=Penaeus japonicus TaxID=27405 RepID=UPI001C716467|nr:SH3 domain-containing protein C23A1.17-like [Penaeus japonicus]
MQEVRAAAPPSPLTPHAHPPSLRPPLRLPHLLLLFFLFFLISPSVRDVGVAGQRKAAGNIPLLGAIPNTSFTCAGRTAGYYADPETGCQVYHMCDTLEKQYSVLCPNYTLFNQKFMVCDHWYMVNCSSATTFYDLNHHIGEVPDKTKDNGTGANAIHDDDGGSPEKDSPGKEPKSSPAPVTFKAPGTPPTKPLFPPGVTSNSQRTSPKPTASPAQIPAEVSTPQTFPVTSKPSSAPETFKGPPLPTKLDSRVDIPFIQTTLTAPSSPMVPAFVARDPVSKFSFTSNKREDSSFDPVDLQDIVFRPLVVRPKIPNRIISTDLVPPPTLKPLLDTAIPLDQRARQPTQGGFTFPLNSTASREFRLQNSHLQPPRRESSVTLKPLEIGSNVPFTSPNIGAPVIPQSPKLGAPAIASVPVPSILLEAPPVFPIRFDFGTVAPSRGQRLHTHFPVVRMKQEAPTPLASRTGLLRPLHAPVSSVAVDSMHFTSARGNRDFFIPSEGLTLPAEDLSFVSGNSLGEPHNHHNHDHDHDHDHMTMVFPADPNEEFSALKLNPECPRCHPAFLKPGQCTPCVLIR